MRELKSTGCVTVRDTEKRLLCMDNFATADLLFYMEKMAAKKVHIFHEEQQFAIPAYTLQMKLNILQ